MGFILAGPGAKLSAPFSPVGNAGYGVPTAFGGDLVRFAGAAHLRNAGDGVPYGFVLRQAMVAADGFNLGRVAPGGKLSGIRSCRERPPCRSLFVLGLYAVISDALRHRRNGTEAVPYGFYRTFSISQGIGSRVKFV